MIKIQDIQQIVEREIANSDKFIVDIKISGDNKIDIVIDSDSSISIDDCVNINRAIEESFNRDEEDYELQVSSAGLDQPLKLLRQYKKNIGKLVDITFKKGKKLTAKLIAATDTSIDVEYEEKVLLEGKKRKQLVTKNETIALDTTNAVKCNLDI